MNNFTVTENGGRTVFEATCYDLSERPFFTISVYEAGLSMFCDEIELTPYQLDDIIAKLQKLRYGS